MSQKAKEEVVNEATKELWAVAECYKERPQEIVGALIAVTALIGNQYGLSLGQLIQVITKAWNR